MSGEHGPDETAALQKLIDMTEVVVLPPDREYRIDPSVGLKIPINRTLIMQGGKSDRVRPRSPRQGPQPRQPDSADAGEEREVGPDETAALQQLIDENEVVHLVPREYWINPSVGLKIPSNRTLILHGATICIFPGHADKCRAFETVPGSSNIRILGGTVIGDMSHSGQFRIGLRIDQAHDVLVAGTIFQDWSWDGVHVGGNEPCTNVVIVGVEVYNFGRNAISVVNATGITIERCILVGCPEGSDPGAGIDIEPNATECVENLTILDCICSDNQVGIYIHPGQGEVGIDHRLLGNLCERNRSYGIIANSIDAGVLYDNHVTDAPKGISVGGATDEVRACDLTVAFNTVEESGQPFILAGVRDSEIVRNPVGPISIVALGVAGDMTFRGNS
jgi:parallel beta helix pectate lyase-like protein